MSKQSIRNKIKIKIINTKANVAVGASSIVTEGIRALLNFFIIFF